MDDLYIDGAPWFLFSWGILPLKLHWLTLAHASASSRYRGGSRGARTQGVQEEEGQETRRGLYGELRHFYIIGLRPPALTDLMTAFVSRSRLYILSGWRRCPRSRRRFGRLCKLGASSRSCSLVCRSVPDHLDSWRATGQRAYGRLLSPLNMQMTTDEEVQRNLLRLHGLNLMNNILREYEKDIHVITLVSLERMGPRRRWTSKPDV